MSDVAVRGRVRRDRVARLDDRICVWRAEVVTPDSTVIESTLWGSQPVAFQAAQIMVRGYRLLDIR